MLPDEYSPDELDRINVLRVAEGYLELKMLEEAEQELHHLPQSQMNHPEVLDCRLKLLMRLGRWEEAVELGHRLCKECPDLPLAFIHTAYCLHEMSRTEEALRTLRLGPEMMQEVALYHYNCACYLCVLGSLREAKAALRTAFALDEKLRTDAQHDPDLEALRAEG